MKRIGKRIAATAVAACAAASALALGACGTVDYTTYTWDDFAAVSYEQWDKKEIAYQMYTDEEVALGFNLFAHVLLNMYSDGSMIYFVAGLYTTPDSMKDSVWYDRENHISWASFGVWDESDNTIETYFLNPFASMNDAKNGTSTTIVKEQSWADHNAENLTGKFYMPFGKVGDDYVYKQTETRYLPLGAANNRGEGMNLQAELTLHSASDVKYKTIEEWIDTYIDGAFDQA